MPNVLRTLLIADNKNRSLLYGHSIVWELSEIDYSIKKWKQHTLGDISVYFKDINDEASIASAVNSGVFNLSPDLDIQLTINYPESDHFFIEMSYEEDNFKPFIGLCTFAKVHFLEYSSLQRNGFLDYTRAHEESFRTIQEKYHIDLLTKPHLIGSFTIFTPTRIEEAFKGIETEDIVGYKIALFDYFNLYKGAKVYSEATSESKTHTESFLLDNEMHEINCGFVPDRHTTKIEFNGQTIYRSSFSLLKKIQVKMHINEERKIVSGNTVVRQIKSTEGGFDV